MRRKRRQKIDQKDFRKILCVILPIVLLAVIYVGIQKWESAYYTVDVQTEPEVSMAPIIEERESKLIDGKTYYRKENLDTYLYLGIDSTLDNAAETSYYGGGQADVILLLVIDHDARTYSILQLNRDTIAQIPVLGVLGEEVGKREAQICLAYGYGDGKKQSCKNEANAVSEYLWDQPIEKFMSMHMDGIPTLNDAVGGVTITADADCIDINPAWVEGTTVLLQGNEAQRYLRARKGVGDQTNVSRMARHRQYLNGLFNILPTMSAKSILNTFDALNAYITTNIGTETIEKIVDCLKTYSFEGIFTIEGESRIGEKGNNEFHSDAASLQNVMLRLFYEDEAQASAKATDSQEDEVAAALEEFERQHQKRTADATAADLLSSAPTAVPMTDQTA